MEKKKNTSVTVTFMCPNLRCRKILMVPQGSRGKRVRCTYCGITLKVPQAKKDVFIKNEVESKIASFGDKGRSAEEPKKKRNS